MVSLLNKNVVELSKRREDCLSAAILKIEDIFDFTKIYKMNQNSEIMKLVMSDLKSKIRTKNINNNSSIRTLRYIDKSTPMSFIDNLVSLCEDVYNNIISHEVRNFKKDLSEYLDNIKDVDMYKKSLNDVAYLFGVSKEKEMKKDIFQIKQNLISCLRYNIKIEREIDLG